MGCLFVASVFIHQSHSRYAPFSQERNRLKIQLKLSQHIMLPLLKFCYSACFAAIAWLAVMATIL
jgi:hypothetical protein